MKTLLIKKPYLFVLTLLALHLLLLIKLKFTAWPEMLLWPYLNIHGWQLYRDMAIAHTPLMLFKLDIFYYLFGVGVIQLKVFTWLVILFFDWLIYFLNRKLFNTQFAVMALGFFIGWQLFYDGNGLWFDLFMAVSAFIAYFFAQKKNWLLVGIFWMLAVVSKQTAIWFLIPIVISIFTSKWLLLKQNLFKFIGGSLLILMPFLVIIWGMGVLPDFFNWAIKFGVIELPRAQGQVQLPDLKNLAISLFPFTVFLPLLLAKKDKPFNLAFWAIAGMLGSYPRFEYFHFQPAVAFLAVASATVFSRSWAKSDLVKAFSPVYVLIILYLFGGFFMRNWGEGTRFYEKDVQDIASYVKENTDKGDSILALNYWDSIYPLSDSFPATDPWIPQLSWYMQTPGIQEKMVDDLKISKPKLILVNPYLDVGLGSYKPQVVYDYVSANYKLKEKVDGIDILIPR